MPTKKSSKYPRVPLPVAGIQVNFCKNIECSNFGRPASHLDQKRGPGILSADDYIVGSKKRQRVRLLCKRCNQYSMLKSNQGVMEETVRLFSYLDREQIIDCCPNTECPNYGIGVEQKGFYHKHTPTSAGSRRFRCKACGKVFAISEKPTLRQRIPHKNKTIYKLLMNKGVLSRICEVTEISFQTLYDKIDFLHKQCMAFAAERERRLVEKLNLHRLYLASDRQEYIVNWTNTRDKRNVILKAVGTADMRSGYVFGMHLNYDPAFDPKLIREAAAEIEDEDQDMPFRQFARFWLEADHKAAERKRTKQVEPIPLGGLEEDIKQRYLDALGRDEIEASDDPVDHGRLPRRGMQIHEEYTLYGHYFFLKKLFKGVEKVRFFLDQDSGMRAACLTAFADEILDTRCDAFYVRINKDLNRHQKERLVGESKKAMEEAQAMYPYLSEKSIRLLKITEEMKKLTTIGRWDDRWLEYPFPDMSEPEKAVCYLTNRNDLEEMQLANLYHMASLHQIDSFFNQIRTRLNPLDRPKRSKSDQNRVWGGYLPYNPALVQKLLDMFRVYYNYHLKGDIDKLTPAVRLGLAKAPIAIDEIVNFHRPTYKDLS